LKERWGSLPDLSWREGAIVAPIVVAMLWIGLHPAPVLERMRPTSEQVSHQLSGGGRPQIEATAGLEGEIP
ncbi:MAG: hypothetical protein OEV60_12685, partial [Actinomycetota bacterium]|nr:hypothetical protein [Actinomycetota bacterium]